MKKKYFLNGLVILGFILFFFTSFAQTKSVSIGDKKTVLTFTPRINSTGHFPYTGSLLNHHLNADFNLYYQKHNFGFFVFKSLDLEDISSDVNYLQPGVFVKLPIGKRFSVTPYGGFVFEQTKSFSDKGSDVFLALVTTFKKNNIKIENTALILNFLELGSHRNLTNRLEVNLSFKKMGASWFTWHKTGLFGIKQYVSTAISFKFPKVSLTKALGVESSIMFQTYVTNYKPSYALRRGAVFSLAFPLDIKSK